RAAQFYTCEMSRASDVHKKSALPLLSISICSDTALDRTTTMANTEKDPGHFVSECPKPRKLIDPEYLKTVTCFSCYEKGHYSPDCPNRNKKDDTSPPSLFDENTVKYLGPTEKQQQQYFGYGSTMNMAPPPPPPSTPVAQYSSDDTEPAQKPATESELEYEEFARKHGHGAFIYFDKIHKSPKSPLPKGPQVQNVIFPGLMERKKTSDNQSGITLGTLQPQPSTPVAQSDNKNTEPAQKPATKPDFVYDEFARRRHDELAREHRYLWLHSSSRPVHPTPGEELLEGRLPMPLLNLPVDPLRSRISLEEEFLHGTEKLSQTHAMVLEK
ncbi:uncharacterized protein LOC132752315, partial [Ruditapes philippinarum]|uniref:uncharacterized protein LOC132752315 n=1 Tax=Ruditapes philippinarum TaxID=129788 RepID=UPI00295ACC89